MANEAYEYTLELVVQHARLSAAEIGTRLSGLASRSAVSVGDVNAGQRLARVSTWVFSPCDSRIDARRKLLRSSLAELVQALKPYSDVIRDLRSDGSVSCDVDIFSTETCSVCEFDALVLRDLGSIGVDINLCFYERDHQGGKGGKAEKDRHNP